MKASLGELGYRSAYTSNNLGSVFVIMIFTCVALVVIAILELVERLDKCLAPERAQSCFIARLNTKIKEQILWNFVIRLLLEGTLETAFCVFFNLQYGEFDTSIFGAWFNYFFSCLLGVTLVLLPIWIVVFYLKNFDQLEKEDFQKKFGAVYEGLKPTEKTWIVYPVYFIVRRVLFMVISLLLYRSVTAQLLLMQLLTLCSAGYILHFWPFDESLVNSLEAMNECFTLAMLHVSFCFSDLIDNVDTQYLVGYIFIACMSLCILIHLFFLFKDMVWKLILQIRRWRYRRNNPHLFKQKKSCCIF
jgi:hypothetical protein